MQHHMWLQRWISAAATLLVVGCAAETELDDGELSPDEDDLGLAVQALSEAEPNNTFGQGGVKTIILGEDNKGSLSTTDTVDYWRLSLGARTYVNLYLGDIPSGSNYDLELFKDGVGVWAGKKMGNANEMVVKLDVKAGVYALKVSATTNPQVNKQYLLRAAVTAISRAREWVNVQMPYCQAANNKPDPVCGGTCTRTGAAASPAWDPYRSDCSGYVSWAWGLSAPGLTTATLPSAFSAVSVTDLQPGDILLHQKSSPNDSGHTFLFEKWIDKASGKAAILEEDTCGTVAKSKTATFSSVASGTTTNYLGRSYTASRYVMPQ